MQVPINSSCEFFSSDLLTYASHSPDYILETHRSSEFSCISKNTDKFPHGNYIRRLIALTMISGRNKSRNKGLFYLQPLRVPFLMGGHERHGSSYHYTQEARRENTEKVQRKAWVKGTSLLGHSFHLSPLPSNAVIAWAIRAFIRSEFMLSSPRTGLHRHVQRSASYSPRKFSIQISDDWR